MKQTLATLLILSSFISPAFADITDLPDPGQIDDSYTATQRGSLTIQNISRKTGGELLNVVFKKPLTLTHFEIYVSSQPIQIFSAKLFTSEGRVIIARAFTETGKLETKKLYVSENLNLSEAVVFIELQTEAYGENAEIQFMAYSNSGTPELLLSRKAIPQKPAQDNKPSSPKPQTPSKPAPPPTERAFKVGDPVGYFSYSADVDPKFGTIKEIYANGKYLIQGPGRTDVVDRKELTLLKSCNSDGEFCKGSIVYYQNSSYYEGKVIAHFGKRIIIEPVSSPNYFYYLKGEDVFAKRNCTKKSNLCVGARVIVATSYSMQKARILRVFPDESFQIQYDGSTYPSHTEPNSLFRDVETSCAKSLCVGNRGLYESESGNFYPGLIKKIYDNSLVVMKLDGGNVIYATYNQVSKAQ